MRKSTDIEQEKKVFGYIVALVVDGEVLAVLDANDDLTTDFTETQTYTSEAAADENHPDDLEGCLRLLSDFDFEDTLIENLTLRQLKNCFKSLPLTTF